jgi:hypothetical protein
VKGQGWELPGQRVEPALGHPGGDLRGGGMSAGQGQQGQPSQGNQQCLECLDLSQIVEQPQLDDDDKRRQAGKVDSNKQPSYK